jgi:hypothetical protein
VCPDGHVFYVSGGAIGPNSRGELLECSRVSLSFGSQRTAVSEVGITTGKVYSIGLCVEMLNPESWPASGSTVTILVEPVEGADSLRWLKSEEEAEQGATEGRSEGQ